MAVRQSAAKPRVLVMGEDTRAFLAVIRSLGRMGLSVHVAWCPLNSAALKSKYIERYHYLPEYRSDDSAWLSAFNRLQRERQFDLILPCNDGTILPLQTHRSQLADSSRVCLLPDDTYRICSSKEETYRLASELAVPLPAQTVAATLADVQAAIERFGFPLVLKPKTSSSAINPVARQEVLKLRSPADVEGNATALLRSGEILVQQNFIGKGVGIEVLCREGEILTCLQHERVHEPLMGGGSSYRKSVHLHAGMLDATRRIMRALHYTGVAMVEYKWNPQTQAWVLIEINARFWGSLPLSIAAGLDFPSYLYEMVVLGKTDFKRDYRVNVYARHWSLDLQWMLANARADHSNPDLMTVPWPKVAGEIGNIVLLREYSDTLHLDDPRPAFADLAAFFRQKTFILTKRVGALRKIQRREALRALRNSRRIGFVCHGNICRSPFAELAFRRVVSGEIASFSSGVFPRADRRSPDAAVKAAERFGVDLGAHRSRVMSPSDAEEADLIFVFERKNVEELEARFAGVESKIHYFGCLDNEGPLEIEDPYGGDVARFVECYSRIVGILENTRHCCPR